MTENLKAARRDLAADLDCTEDCLRELQKQAMEAFVLVDHTQEAVEGVLIQRRIDALLDGPGGEE